MSSFVQEFKKYQFQERVLTGAIVLFSLLAPATFSLLRDKQIHWALSAAAAGSLLGAGAVIYYVRARVGQKILAKYQHLDVGYVLSKKLTAKHDERYVIINKGYNHYCLKSLNTGEQMLVSKHRVREHFDIAN